jgi:serpin B
VNSAGQSQQVSMMRQTRSFHHIKNDQFEAIELDYQAGAASGDALSSDGTGASFVVVMPALASSLETFVARQKTDSSVSRDLDWGAITQALDAAAPERGELILPKFKLESGSSLKASLEALGMKDAFTSERADFRDLSSGSNLFLSDVAQKAYVAVDEKGTEAAAVTSVVIGITAMLPQPSFQMKVDRPFLFAIRDKSSGALLFLGAVQNLK